MILYKFIENKNYSIYMNFAFQTINKNLKLMLIIKIVQYMLCCESKVILCWILIYEFSGDIVDLSFIESIMICIGDISHFPFILSYWVDQINSWGVFVLNLDQVSLLLNGGVKINMRIQLIEDACVEWSNNGVHCVVQQNTRHIIVLHDVNWLIDV